MDSDHDITITVGTRADYDALARFHYLAGPPATVALILRAAHADTLVGVLVVSMPTLNAWWRAPAWPGWLVGDRRQIAQRINVDLRTISRVIIDPRWRATGVATRLVRHYLHAPLTCKTEALAAMGAACPFFARAGMRQITPRSAHHELQPLLRRAHVRAWELMDQRRAERAARRCPWFEPALRHWAQRGRASRPWRDAPFVDLAAWAGWRASQRPIAYVHEARDDKTRCGEQGRVRCD